MPAAIRLRDAREILSAERLFLIDGEVAAFSDLFRYHMLHKLGGWWIDADVVCLTPAPARARCYFGWQDEKLINTAIMKLPPRHALSAWLVRRAEGLGQPRVWGALGPHLLTRGVHELELGRWATPSTRAYPVQWREAVRLLDPAATEEVAPTIGAAPFLHLWNEILQQSGVDKSAPPPEGSALS